MKIDDIINLGKEIKKGVTFEKLKKIWNFKELWKYTTFWQKIMAVNDVEKFYNDDLNISPNWSHYLEKRIVWKSKKIEIYFWIYGMDLKSDYYIFIKWLTRNNSNTKKDIIKKLIKSLIYINIEIKKDFEYIRKTNDDYWLIKITL